MVQSLNHAIPCSIILIFVPLFSIILIVYAGQRYPRIRQSGDASETSERGFQRRQIIAGVIISTLALLSLLLGSFGMVSRLHVAGVVILNLLRLELGAAVIYLLSFSSAFNTTWSFSLSMSLLCATAVSFVPPSRIPVLVSPLLWILFITATIPVIGYILLLPPVESFARRTAYTVLFGQLFALLAHALYICVLSVSGNEALVALHSLKAIFAVSWIGCVMYSVLACSALLSEQAAAAPAGEEKPKLSSFLPGRATVGNRKPSPILPIRRPATFHLFSPTFLPLLKSPVPDTQSPSYEREDPLDTLADPFAAHGRSTLDFGTRSAGDEAGDIGTTLDRSGSIQIGQRPSSPFPSMGVFTRMSAWGTLTLPIPVTRMDSQLLAPQADVEGASDVDDTEGRLVERSRKLLKKLDSEQGLRGSSEKMKA